MNSNKKTQCHSRQLTDSDMEQIRIKETEKLTLQIGYWQLMTKHCLKK